MGKPIRAKTCLASVIIVSYNSENFIGDCLKSVFKSDFKNFEVVVVENGSSDKSLKILKKLEKKFPLRVIKNSTNLGSCRARNIGVKNSNGKYLIFLDSDVKVDHKLISEYVALFGKDKSVGSIHGKSLNAEYRNRFDSAGELFDSFGLLCDRAGGAVDRGQFNTVVNIASGKACSFACRRDLFQKLGGYDEDFFFFVEEPDLDLRVWASGKRVVYLPTAVCWHAYGTSFKDDSKYYSRYLVRYYGARNYLLMNIKNWGLKRLFIILPLNLTALYLMSLLFLLKGKFLDWAYMQKGIFWNFINILLILKKRSAVQEMRKVDDSELPDLFVKRPPSHYFAKAMSYLGSRLM